MKPRATIIACNFCDRWSTGAKIIACNNCTWNYVQKYVVCTLSNGDIAKKPLSMTCIFALPKGLYILPMFFFLYLACSAKLLTGLYILLALMACSSHWAFWFFQGTLPWQPIKVEKSAFFPGPTYFALLPFGNGLLYRNSDFKGSIEWISLHCVQFRNGLEDCNFDFSRVGLIGNQHLYTL